MSILIYISLEGGLMLDSLNENATNCIVHCARATSQSRPVYNREKETRNLECQSNPHTTCQEFTHKDATKWWILSSKHSDFFFKVNYFTRRMEFRTAIVVTLYNTWDSPKTLISSRKQNLYQFYWFLGFLREILIIFQTAISRLLVVAQYIK
jgi:hypothetical protein